MVVDRLMKYANFLSLAHPFIAQEVARVFLDQVGKLHGLPQVIVSNRDNFHESTLEGANEVPRNTTTRPLLTTLKRSRLKGSINAWRLI